MQRTKQLKQRQNPDLASCRCISPRGRVVPLRRRFRIAFSDGPHLHQVGAPSCLADRRRGDDDNGASALPPEEGDHLRQVGLVLIDRDVLSGCRLVRQCRVVGTKEDCDCVDCRGAFREQALQKVQSPPEPGKHARCQTSSCASGLAQGPRLGV